MTFPGFEPSAVARALGYLPETASDFAEGYFERVGELTFSPGLPNALRSRTEEGLCLRLRAGGISFLASRDSLTEEAFRSAYRQVARTLPNTPLVLRPLEDAGLQPDEPDEELMTAPARLQSRLLQRGIAFRYQATFACHRRDVVVAASSHSGSVQRELFYSVRLQLPGGPWGTLVTSLGTGVPERLADLAAEFARYEACKPEVVSPGTVILGPHAAAVFLHEAVAHTLEVDTLAAGGDPRAAIGHQLGAEVLTVFDDPASAPDSVRRSFDDEGIPVVRRGLMRKGRIEQPISDRLWSERIDGLLPGAGRRADRSSLPGPRSSHLEVVAGESSPRDLVRSTSEGLFIPMLCRGQLDLLRGTCRFDAPGAIRIRGGRMEERIGRCRVEGSAADLLSSVVAVGSDVHVAGAGWCAKSDQKLAVWASTPSLVLEDLGSSSLVSDPEALLCEARDERDRLLSETSGTESQLEVYLKTGLTRTFTHEGGAESVQHAEERGWAVRSQSVRSGGFACGTGPPHLPLEPARTPQEDLPEGVTSSYLPPSDLNGPLLSEGDGLALLRRVAEGLASEIPGARLLRGRIEDGSAVSALASSRGMEATSRFRVATMKVQAVGPAAARGDVSLAGAAREARGLSAQAVARRLADRLVISADGVSGVATRSPTVISPEVSTAVLESIVPLFIGPQLWSTARTLAGPTGQFAADGMDLVDDARLVSGLVPVGVDGEGVPTGRTTLVEGGALRQPLLSRFEADFQSSVDPQATIVGCRYRASYRDAPTPAPSHLFPASRSRVSVASLISDLGGGFYFIDVTGPVKRHFGEGWVQVPVCGFQVRGGRATGPVRGVLLHLKIGGFLRSVRGMGRDLRFRPRNGCVGAPTMLLAEAEILPA